MYLDIIVYSSQNILSQFPLEHSLLNAQNADIGDEMIMNMAPPQPGECQYNGRYGNYCHRPGLSIAGGLCYWHSRLPKTREKFVQEYQAGNSFEGVTVVGLDLSNLDLNGAALRGFTAHHCSFNRTNLSRAWMDMAAFEGCNFIEADLSEIEATLTHFTNCILGGANLQNANLLSADLRNSSFNHAKLQGARVGKATLMLVPGMGNPDQYTHALRVPVSKGQIFGGIHLDPKYLEARTSKNPLNQLWLYGVQEQLDAAKEPQPIIKRRRLWKNWHERLWREYLV
ncbi:MAG: pentapeptide repeat-containing protein [Anaerolineae bacterium]|nr:pentapeptide repeat-containing protein [Anaerolineae bacterium]